MDTANKEGALLVGTGDLSELALGWCTYNADQMSMYGVNSSIPKTLVRHLVCFFMEEAKNSNKKLSDILKDILDTPVSPELLPPENGIIGQKTEDLVVRTSRFLPLLHTPFRFFPKKNSLPRRKSRASIFKRRKNQMDENFL